MSVLSERKEERLYKQVLENEIVSPRTYNMYLGGTIAYGLIINIIMCATCVDLVLSINPIIFIIGYFICAIAGTFISAKSDKPAMSFLGYNLVVLPVGLVVTSAVYYYGGLSSYIVLEAFVYTACITCIMICLSILKPEFFSKLGGILLGSLIGLIVVELVLMIFGVSQTITTWAGVIIFSLYIGYDYWKAQQYPKTVDNAIDSALDIYLDIINLFLRLLSILGGEKSSKNKF
ncbi:MAG: Bax inhibitor-1 family protein [Butyrivibrio sp.]|nr:Bax inhibitor-1 family protein [Butyrivibrio sp.]